MSLPIGGFMPLPLPMMIPFMAAQSAAMAQAFGTYFQYGKRKISSMTNEEFNRLTPQNMHEQLTADIRLMIPTLATSMHTYDSSMTPQIIKEFSEIAKSAISETTTEVVNTVGGGLELGVQTSKTQINDFIAALTTFMATQHNQHYVNPNTTVQQSNVTVKDIELEIKKEHIGDPSSGAQQKRIDARNKYAGDNLNTLNAKLRLKTNTTIEIQILNELIAKLGGNPKVDIPIPKQKPLSVQQSAQKAYLTKTVNFQKQILHLKEQIATMQNNLKKKWISQTQYNYSYQSIKNLLVRARKDLMNYITISKNNIQIKSVATRDWNDKIWL